MIPPYDTFGTNQNINKRNPSANHIVPNTLNEIVVIPTTCFGYELKSLTTASLQNLNPKRTHLILMFRKCYS